MPLWLGRLDWSLATWSRYLIDFGCFMLSWFSSVFMLICGFQLYVLLLFLLSYRFSHWISVRSIFLCGGRVLPCAMHLTYTCFLWCTSELGEEQVQLGDRQEPEDPQQECLVDGAEEGVEAYSWWFHFTFVVHSFSIDRCIFVSLQYSFVQFCIRACWPEFYVSDVIPFVIWYFFILSCLLYSCWLWSGTCDFVLFYFQTLSVLDWEDGV